MARYIERTRYDWWATIWKLAAFVAVVVFTIVVILPWRGVIITVVIIVLSLWLYVRLQARGSGYRCAGCGKAFQVPTIVDFFTGSAVGKNPDGTYYSYKNLTCPHCGKRTKARVVKRAEAQSAGSGTMLK